MNDIEISIIVPVFNTKEKYLRECLDSLINQTIKDKIEIIVLDDGSEKQCAYICDLYCKNNVNLKVIHQKNEGLGKTRNNGIKIAKGKWIMFVDSDDWVENNICEKLLEEDNDNVDIIISSCNECFTDEINEVIMFENKRKSWKTAEEREKLELQIISRSVLQNKMYDAKYLTIAWARLYRRDYIMKNKLYDISKLRFKEDNIFNLYCFEYANKIVYKNNCNLYNYRQCKDSISHNKDDKMIELYLEYLREELNFIKNHAKSNKFYEAHYNITLQSFENIIGKYILNKKENFIDKKKQIEKLMQEKEFNEALNNVNKKYLSRYFRIFIWFVRNKMYFLALCILKIRNSRKEEKKLYD